MRTTPQLGFAHLGEIEKARICASTTARDDGRLFNPGVFMLSKSEAVSTSGRADYSILYTYVHIHFRPSVSCKSDFHRMATTFVRRGACHRVRFPWAIIGAAWSLSI